MKVITQDEAQVWMKNKSINLNETEGYNVIKSERIPTDSGRKNYIAKAISNLEYGEKCLLYINEYGIWPSSENMELFNGYRKSIGINEKLPEKPAHIITSSEKVELYCLICMIFYFYWDAILIPGNANEIIHISHDEYIEILAKSDISYKSAFISGFGSIFK